MCYHRDMPGEEISGIKKALHKEIKKAVKREQTSVLLNACTEMVVIQEEYQPSVYTQRNRYTAERSDRVIAVYDGREKGGTVRTIRFAHRLQKELREIPVGLNLDKNRINLGCGRVK